MDISYKKTKNKGILFWITGLSGSGKTSIAKNIKKEIIKNYGPTLAISGDDFRKIFKFKGFSKKDRYRYLKHYQVLNGLCTLLTIDFFFSKL